MEPGQRWSGILGSHCHWVWQSLQVSKISLVDLAGSERAKDSGAEGKRLQVCPCVARDVLQSSFCSICCNTSMCSPPPQSPPLSSPLQLVKYLVVRSGCMCMNCILPLLPFHSHIPFPLSLPPPSPPPLSFPLPSPLSSPCPPPSPPPLFLPSLPPLSSPSLPPSPFTPTTC